MRRNHTKRAFRILSLLAGGLCLLSLPGCEKAMRNMYEQPKYDPLAESSFWPDGRSARPLEPGVVVRSAGVLAASSSGRNGDLAQPARTAPPVTMEALRRGRERYDIYCAPCHSVSGDGDGMVVRRGFPAPASLDTPPMRAASDAHLFDVITSGYGVSTPSPIGSARRTAGPSSPMCAPCSAAGTPASRTCRRRSGGCCSRRLTDAGGFPQGASPGRGLPAGRGRRRAAAHRGRPAKRRGMAALVSVRLAVRARPVAGEHRLGGRAQSDGRGLGARGAPVLASRAAAVSLDRAACPADAACARAAAAVAGYGRRPRRMRVTWPASTGT